MVMMRPVVYKSRCRAGWYRTTRRGDAVVDGGRRKG